MNFKPSFMKIDKLMSVMFISVNEWDWGRNVGNGVPENGFCSFESKIIVYPLIFFIVSTVAENTRALTTVYTLKIATYEMLILTLLTHSLTPGALLEKPPIVQLFKNFPAFYGIFITVFTRALHWSLFWARSIQSLPSHPFDTDRPIYLISKFAVTIDFSHVIHLEEHFEYDCFNMLIFVIKSCSKY
jgi:hypothetical protein